MLICHTRDSMRWPCYPPSMPAIPTWHGRIPAIRATLDHETMRAAAALLGEKLAEAGFAAGDCAAAGSVPTCKESPTADSMAPTIADVLEAARRALLHAQLHSENNARGNTGPVPPGPLYRRGADRIRSEAHRFPSPPARHLD